MDWTIGWNMVSALSTAITALIIWVTAFFAAIQISELSKARQIDAFSRIVDRLQRPEVREARGILIEELKDKDFGSWTDRDFGMAETACHNYDTVGIMVTNKLIDERLIVNEWRDSIIKCYEAAEAMIIEYRKKRGKDFWDDFHKLYEKAKKISS